MTKFSHQTICLTDFESSQTKAIVRRTVIVRRTDLISNTEYTPYGGAYQEAASGTRDSHLFPAYT